MMQASARLQPRRLGIVAAVALLVALAVPPSAAEAAPGPWRIVTSPTLGAGHNHLQEVSCVRPDRCVAVGFSEADGTRRSTATTLVGGVWAPSAAPQRGALVNNLWNVSCVSTTRCVAVGFYQDARSGFFRTLIASFNGTAWTLDSTPSRANADNFLFGVDCFDATHCVAVGRSFDTTTQISRSLVLTLDGAVWAITATPNRPSADNLLADVSCADLTHCVAVGYSVDDTSGVFSTLIIGRSNVAWSLKPSADRPAASNLLRDVSCPSVTTCVAVGASDPGDENADEQSLIETLAAGAWTIAPSPDRADHDNHLWAVSCSSETQCVAAGQSQNDDKARPLIQTLTGPTWVLTTPAPYRGNTFNYLYGLSCPTRQCTAVGDWLHAATQTFRTSIMTNSP